MEGTKVEGGGRYRLQAMVYMHYNYQEWSRHHYQQETLSSKETRLLVLTPLK
jgi:hypothetical protein